MASPCKGGRVRYVNLRFGLAVDIPTKGYRYDVQVNGSGLTLQSELVTITLYAYWVSNLVTDANNNVVQNSAWPAGCARGQLASVARYEPSLFL
jgi:hypothetical protein